MNQLKEHNKELESVQYSMATENTDLGMENLKLKEHIKELEDINKDLIKDRNENYNIYEAHIKELEETHNLEECPFRSENRELKNRIKELENDKLDVNAYIINLRYERIRYKAIYMRTQANYSSYESWLYGGHLNSMSYDTWLSRVLAIVDAYESRAKQLKEQM